ncbi:MAG: ABC transporter permease, partial [Bryobacteraceae bacterium]
STPLSLLAGHASTVSGRCKPAALISILCAAIAAALLVATATRSINQVAGFFGAGIMLLASLLTFEWRWLQSQSRGVLRGLAPFGFRNATYRPGRSILCIALIAFAAFLIVSIDGFRHDGERPSGDRKAGDGGYALLAESILPVYFDPNTPAGKDGLNLSEIGDATFTAFRLRPGDDTSCLNLYQSRNPRVLGASRAFLEAARFTFQDSVARTPEAKANPWLLLDEPQPDGAIPAIVDANTMMYSLHSELAGIFVMNPGTDHTVKLRIVGALKDSIFQSELVISDRNFLRTFPGEQGHRFFLIDAPAPQVSSLTPKLEEALSDYGFDAAPAAARLAEFHRVENTYLSTFQMLGSLGLLLGTAGLAAVVLRNVLERRRELALLRAVGYNTRDLGVMILAENIFLLVSGLAIGVVSALLAITPAVASRGGRLPAMSLAVLLAAVLATGLAASLVAMRAVSRSPLLSELRSE